LTRAAHDRDRSAQEPRELLHERQAQAAALEPARGSAFQLPERLKEGRDLGFRDANAGVLDGQPQPASLRPQRDRHPPAGGGELDGVGQQVEEDALVEVTIQAHPGFVRHGLKVTHQALAVQERLKVRQDSSGERDNSDGFSIHLDLAGLHLGEVEQTGHHLEEADGVAVHRSQPLALGVRDWPVLPAEQRFQGRQD
jgi:hypothetical protein